MMKRRFFDNFTLAIIPLFLIALGSKLYGNSPSAPFRSAVPPENAEFISLQCFKCRWTSPMFSKEITFQNIEGAINSDTIYLRLCNFNEDGASYDENSTEGWIKGVINGNKFCVKNGEELFTHEPYRGDTTLVYAYSSRKEIRGQVIY